MPFCPECKYEYRPDIETCPDCDVKLVDELPPPVQEPSVVPQSPVCVAAYPLAIQAQGAKLKLESHGIKATLSNEIVGRMMEFAIGFDDGIKVLVSEEDAHKAIEILEQG